MDKEIKDTENQKVTVIGYEEFKKILDEIRPNLMGHESVSHSENRHEIDESSDVCAGCGKSKCDCSEMSNAEILKLIANIEPDDLKHSYSDDDFAEVDEDGNPVKELNEMLSRDARRKLAIAFHMSEEKRDRKRQIALHRFSTNSTLVKRARHLAVNLLKKKLSGGRAYDTLPIGEKEMIDSRIAAMRNAIVRLTTKLVPKVKQIEKERLSHKKYTKE